MVTVAGLIRPHALERRKIIFDPVPPPIGTESSGDPWTEVRSDPLPADRSATTAGRRIVAIVATNRRSTKRAVRGSSRFGFDILSE